MASRIGIEKEVQTPFYLNLSNNKQSENFDLIHDLFQGEYEYVTEHVFFDI